MHSNSSRRLLQLSYGVSRERWMHANASSLYAIEQPEQPNEVRSTALVFDEFGAPDSVLKIRSEVLPPLTRDGVYLRMLMAPINPSDINQIQGVYPIRPSVPNAHAGNEGLAEVIALGSDLKELGWQNGDRVIPIVSPFGTWRTHAFAKASQLLRLPKDIPPLEAATMNINMTSGYRLLRDFCSFEAGDFVIQNAANSGVGRAVIQLAKLMDVGTINIVRKRPDFEQVKEELMKLGATYVLSDEDLTKVETREWFAQPGMKNHIKLGLNSVGGKQAVEMAKSLNTGSPLVTYGNMSRDPMVVPASLLIFKNLQFRGFWMAQWKQEQMKSVQGVNSYNQMMKDLVDAIQAGQLKAPPVEFVDWDTKLELTDELLPVLLQTIRRSQQGFKGKKLVLRFKA